MSKWVYDGYTVTTAESGLVENHNYKCSDCGHFIRVEIRQKPPRYCPNCQKEMSEGEGYKWGGIGRFAGYVNGFR